MQLLGCFSHNLFLYHLTAELQAVVLSCSYTLPSPFLSSVADTVHDCPEVTACLCGPALIWV